MKSSDEFSNKQLVESSKLLSYILRHHPESIGLTLDVNGWADIQELLQKLGSAGYKFSAELLDEVVSQNTKQRFAFSKDNQRIRANQGHSVRVELNLIQEEPPTSLFHGTATQSLENIRKHGLNSSQRNYVHLTDDRKTAYEVGLRHGSPTVLTINAKQMYLDGYKYYKNDKTTMMSYSHYLMVLVV